MSRPVVVISPLSAGVFLAPAFKKRGVPVIAVTLDHADFMGFGSDIQESDFIEIIPNQPNLIEKLRQYDPLAIIPGSEKAVPIADELSLALTPEFANDPKTAEHRLHKALMQQALEDANVPAIETLNTSSEEEVEQWVKTNDLSNSSLVMKPPISACSDKVFHISPQEDWRKAFNCILTEPSLITGEASQTVVVQEQVVGTEFAVGTVSAHGKHYLSHLIQYNKTSSGDRKTVYDHVEFVDYSQELHGELFAYTQQVLDALGIHWGATHTEIMLTEQGPRLIETGARMCGGPVVGFSREATGSSQADKLVEIYVDGDVHTKEYRFKKTVMPVFIRSPSEGSIWNIEAFDGVEKLPTVLNKYLWCKNGDKVPKTVDYITNIGIISLTGEREAIFADYEKIRQMESKLMVQPA